MSIISIESIEFDSENLVRVKAVIEDSILLYPQTMEDPAEYGPGLCEAVFELYEDEIIPDNENELIQYLKNLDLSWELVESDNSDYYYEDDEFY